MVHVVLAVALLGQVNGVHSFDYDGKTYQFFDLNPGEGNYFVDGDPGGEFPGIYWFGGQWFDPAGTPVASDGNGMMVGSSAWLDSEGGGLFGYSPPPVVNVPVELVPVIQGFLDEIVKVVQAVILAWFGFLVLRKGIRWLTAYFAEKKLKSQYWDYGNGFYQGEKNRIYQFRNGRMHRMDGMYAGEDGNVYRGRGRERRQVF